MGYDTYITGGFNVTPSLTEKQIEEWDLGEGGDSDLWAQNQGDPDTVGLVDGEIKVIPGRQRTVVECRYDEPFRAYGFEESVDRLLAHLKDEGKYVVEGAFYASGEESPDFTRYRADSDGSLVSERPEFLWPNGDRGWGA